MDNIELMYRILKYIEDNLDNEEIYIRNISYEHLNISKTRWFRIMEILSDEQYIKGIYMFSVDTKPIIKCYSARITLKGIEFIRKYNCNGGQVMTTMWDINFDYKKVKDEVIELFKKNNLTFSQASRVISLVHRELENKSSNSLVN